jgi:hypothetical protein
MKEFIKAVLSDSPLVSSKRFTLLWSLGLVTGQIIASFCGKPIDNTAFLSLIGLIAALAGLNIAEKIFTK